VSRWGKALLLSTLLMAACASANQQPEDASVDLTAGKCDPKDVFAACSDQCHMPICIVATAMCMGTQWICDCSQTGPCRDMAAAD
jgi:hypothetical protein